MAVEKYLQRYAEPETAVIAPPHAQYDYVLAIPAFRETAALLDQIDLLLTENPRVLVILVINRPDTSPAESSLLPLIRQRYQSPGEDTDAIYFAAGAQSTLLVIDRFSPGRGIAAKQGVGLARKIACDIACRLIHAGIVQCCWIFCSDADVSWPPDYFTGARFASANCSALIYPFCHTSPALRDGNAIALYEFSLHYYVAGLRWAGSPYAWHTIGSTLAINYAHYARVRGFPRRSAGEDFYMLNKLAKTGAILTLNAPVLTIADRDSDRVPFGTGPACARIGGLSQPLEEYLLYHPECFNQLRLAQQLFLQLAHSDHPLELWARLHSEGDRAFTVVLDTMGFGDVIAHAMQHSNNASGFTRHLHNWFDGFRTLKFIHALRDDFYPSINLRQLCRTDSFLLPLLGEQPRPADDGPGLAQQLAHYNQLLRDYNFR
jgi:hypothetical protein